MSAAAGISLQGFSPLSRAQAPSALTRQASCKPRGRALQWSSDIGLQDMPSSSRTCRSWRRGDAMLCAAYESEAYEPELRVADEEYMKEYADLKASLLDNTRKSGAGIAAYMLFTVNGQAALCAFIGMGFSTVYLQWLYRDIDNVKPTDDVPMMNAKEIESPLLRILAIWFASYRHALQPRLLVPILLAALIAAYNSLAETPLTGFEEAALLFGFLSYKVALVLRVVDELSPKEYTEKTGRPMIARIDDGELDLDKWGRPKKPQFTMPTEALPDDVDPDNMGLLPSLLVKTANAVDDMDSSSSSGTQQRAKSSSDERS